MGIFTSKYQDDHQKINQDFHFPTSKNALIIFTRNPELGKCKTRLAKTIGDENALEVYKYLLQHTASISEVIQADRYVFYSEHIIDNDIWDSKKFRKKMQKGSDLGERMLNAFSGLLNRGYEKVAIIGSDLLDLDSGVIETAFRQLDFNDVVIGPAQDGGYYLLAMKALFDHLFKNKNWSTASVLDATLDDLRQHKVYLLKTLNDIDTFEDMQPYHQLNKFYTTND